MSDNRTNVVLKYLEDVLVGDAGFIEPEKDFSVLENFTDEELTEELLRRTSLGKELE